MKNIWSKVMAKDTKLNIVTSLYPTDDQILEMVEVFTKDMNVDNATKRGLQFGYQEGLFKMLEIWKQVDNDRYLTL
jgi:hypothetical protein